MTEHAMFNQFVFRDHVRRLFTQPIDSNGRILHAAVGVSKEGGEVLGAAYRAWIYHQSLNVENILEEAGDVLFYLTALLDQVGYTLQDAALHNVKKLQCRYPSGGFTPAEAVARADKKGDPS